jgi:hypothetical protein
LFEFEIEFEVGSSLVSRERKSGKNWLSLAAVPWMQTRLIVLLLLLLVLAASSPNTQWRQNKDRPGRSSTSSARRSWTILAGFSKMIGMKQLADWEKAMIYKYSRSVVQAVQTIVMS